MKVCSGCCELIADSACRCKYCGEQQPAIALDKGLLDKAILGLNHLLKQGKKRAASHEAHLLRQRISRASNADEFGEQLQQIEQLIGQLGAAPKEKRRDAYLPWLTILATLLLLQMLLPVLLREEPKPLQLPLWEYRIESIPDLNFESQMALLGGQGWELVFARRATDSRDKALYEMIFKRPYYQKQE